MGDSIGNVFLTDRRYRWGFILLVLWLRSLPGGEFAYGRSCGFVVLGG